MADNADIANDQMDYTMNALLARHRQHATSLPRGTAAKSRDCQDCGDPISAGRLETLPFAKRCTECQADQEAHQRHQRHMR